MIVRVIEQFSTPGEYKGVIADDRHAPLPVIIINTLDEGVGHSIPNDVKLIGVFMGEVSCGRMIVYVSFDPATAELQDIRIELRAARHELESTRRERDELRKLLRK